MTQISSVNLFKIPKGYVLERAGKLPDGTSVRKMISIDSLDPNEIKLIVNIRQLFMHHIKDRNIHEIESLKIEEEGETLKVSASIGGKPVTIELQTDEAKKVAREISLRSEQLLAGTGLRAASASSSSVAVENEPQQAQQEVVSPLDAPTFDDTTFNVADVAAKQTLIEIQSAESEKMKTLLNRLNELYNHIDAVGKGPRSEADKLIVLSKLKNEYAILSLQIKQHSEKMNKEHFKALETNLAIMTGEYNKIINQIEDLDNKADKNEKDLQLLQSLKQMKNVMNAKIHKYNEEMGNRSLTTTTFTAYKSHVMSFAAVIEKKLSLLEEQSTLLEAQEKSKGGGIRKFYERRQNSKKLESIKNELKKAPTTEQMQGIAKQIKDKIDGKNGDIPVKNAVKNAYKFESSTKWGEEYLNQALTTPANWTTIRKATVKESPSGRMYISVAINEPLNVEANGGVPAGLRKAEKYKTRATNLIKTTSYMLSEEGRSSPHVSFRGGQFPTVDAAKEALIQMIKAGATLDSLHINALLTPFAPPFIEGTPDKKLLIAHKKNIMKAINELIRESDDPKVRFALAKLRKGEFAMSNFGVNEGAVGELKKKGISLKWLVPGWHTSIMEYSNDASKKLTQSLNKTLKPKSSLDDYKPQDLDRLGAVVQVGQEMEAVWATNAYATAKVGNNQFKLPALWKTMDALLGVTCYTDCMSGKDRTGKVESHAQAYLDEIEMRTIEHKRKLNTKFEELKAMLPEDKQAEWEKRRPFLTAACFQPNEMENICNWYSSTEQSLDNLIKSKIATKLENAQKALGVEGTGEFMPQKRLPKTMGVRLGTSGISKTTPKQETDTCKDALAKCNFPSLSASTLFSSYTIDWKDITKLREHMTALGVEMSPNDSRPTLTGYKTTLEAYRKKHLEAHNVRLSQFASLDITAMNTGKPGFKVEGGEPLARASCGFDRDYVLLEIFGHLDNPKKFREEFAALVGLGELDEHEREQFLSHFDHAGTNMDKYLALIKEIEEAKQQTFFPQAKVKA